LKIKTFWGTSENAVRIKIYCVVISYHLVAIIERDLMINRSISEVLQIFGISLLDKSPIGELFFNVDKMMLKNFCQSILSE